MKAIVQEGYGSPDVLHLREIARPIPSDDRLLVRVRAASVNAADWHLMGMLPHVVGRLLGGPASRVRGADLAGLVEAVGGNVTRFKPGDEVFGVGHGAFAEYATAREDRLAPKPRNLTFEQAAAIPIAGCTALQGLRDHGQLQAGQKALIHGAGGGVGTFAVEIAKALGAHVTAVTRTENLELIRSIGADEVIDYTQEDFAGRGQRYDLVLDIGADRSSADCLRVLSPSGKLVLVGAPSGGLAVISRVLEMMLMPRRGGRRVVFMARAAPEDLVALKDLAEAGKLTPVIDRQYPLSETAEALRYLGTRRVRGKLVIKVG
jgi:NADPH:quinone reductase-like Zn-dependent oxidoreductase